MDVLVAGGTGFIDLALCRELVDRGHTVTAASRAPDAPVLAPGVETAALDVTADGVEERRLTSLHEYLDAAGS